MARYFVTIMTLAALMFVAHTKRLATFTKLSGKEVSANSTWVIQYGSVRLKNCGPPSSFSITPLPPVSNQVTYYELNFTAAHTVTGGELSIYANMWPFEVHYDACDYVQQQVGITLCPLKKGESYMYQDSGNLLDNNYHIIPDKGHLMGNITITNDFDEVILCISFDTKLPPDLGLGAPTGNRKNNEGRLRLKAM